MAVYGEQSKSSWTVSRRTLPETGVAKARLT
jgi:hypothetical protein